MKVHTSKAKKKSPLQKVLNEIQSEASKRIAQLEGQIKEQRDKVALAVASAKAIEPLTKLKTSKEVARFLKLRKIKGVKSDPLECPIARYLRRHAPANVDVEAESETLAVDGVKIGHTPATRNFIDQFDEGDFSDLDEYPDE